MVKQRKRAWVQWVAWAIVLGLLAALLLPALTARAAEGPSLAAVGLAWTSRTTGSGSWLHGVAEGRGAVVVVGDSGTVLTSPDGAAWTSRTAGSSSNLNAVAGGGGRFTAVGAGGTVLVSGDGGASWAAGQSGTTRTLNGVAYGGGLFVAVGDQGTVVTSADGISWAAPSAGTTAKLYAVTYGGGRFVAVGAGGTVLVSGDGVSWSARKAGSGYLSGVAYGNGRFLAVGEGDSVYTSADGTAWTAHPMNPAGSYGLWGVTFGEGIFVAAGGIGNVLATVDGAAWVRHDTSGSFTFLENVVYVGGQFLAVGNFGTVRTSGAAALKPDVSLGASVEGPGGEPEPDPGPVKPVGLAGPEEPAGPQPVPGTSAGAVVKDLPTTCKARLVPGPRLERKVGLVTVKADGLGVDAQGKETLCGNVTINDVLKLDGTVTLDRAGAVQGEGAVYVEVNNGRYRGSMVLFEGKFRMDGVDLLKEAGVDRLELGGLKVQITKLTFPDGGVRIAGYLTLPPLLGEAKVTMENLQVINGVLDLQGAVRLPDGPLAGTALQLKDVSAELDTMADAYSGKGQITFHKLFSLRAQLGIYQGQLDAVGLGMAGLFKVPVGSTGLVLTGFDGTVENLANPRPLKVTALADLEGVLKLGELNSVHAKQVGLILDLSGKVTGKGRVQVFEVLTIKAELTLGTDGGHFIGTVDLLEILTGTIELKVTTDQIYGKGQARLALPKEVPLVGGRVINRSMQVGTQGIQFEVKVAGLLDNHCTVTWRYEWNCTSKQKIIKTGSYLAPVVAATDPAIGFADTSFTIAPGTEQAAVVLTWDGGDADFSLIAPDGRVITPAEATMDNPTVRYEKSDERREALYAMLNPMPGTWKHVVTTRGATKYTVELVEFTPPPAFTLTAPAADTSGTGPVTVRWNAGDASPGSTVSLFYARSADELGTRFATGVDASAGAYTWNIHEIPSGTYMIYALLENGTDMPVRAQAAGKVLINNPDTPAVPQGLTARAAGSGEIELTWSPVPGADGYRLHLLDEPGASEAVGDVTRYTWTGLEPGRSHRFAVSAYRFGGLESQPGPGVSVALPVPNTPALQVSWPQAGTLQQKELVLRGTVSAGATASIYVDDVKVAEGLTGNFTQNLTLGLGQNTVAVVAVNAAGDRAEAVREITVDTIPPQLIVNGLTSEMHVQSSALLVSGATEPGADLTLNGRPVPVRPDGSFAVAMALKRGTNPVLLIARDAAGNEMTFRGYATVTAALAETCGTRFGDVSAGHSACTAIEQLAALKVISGYPDGTFKPERGVTRAEFAKMLVAALGKAPRPDRTLPFSDTGAHWSAAQGFLQTAVALGAIAGFPDGTFQPEAPVTRAQIAKIAAAAAGREAGGTSPYTDVTATDWFAGWAGAAADLRLIGRGAPWPVWAGARFDGNLPATRAEAAMVLANLLRGE